MSERSTIPDKKILISNPLKESKLGFVRRWGYGRTTLSLQRPEPQAHKVTF